MSPSCPGVAPEFRPDPRKEAKRRRKRRKKILQRFKWPFEYAIFRIGSLLLARRDPAARMRLARILGGFMARVIPFRRALIEEQVSASLPEIRGDARAALIHDIYVHTAAFALELLTMPRLSPGELQAQFEIDPGIPEKFAELNAAGTGFILVAGHLANWEWTGACAAGFGQELVAVAKPMSNPMSEKFISAMRESAGIKIISTEASMKPLVSQLRKGGGVALVADQDAGRDGLFIDFFGRKASTAPGPAWLARRMKVPLFHVHVRRLESGKIAARFDAPLMADPSLGEAEDVLRLTQAHTALLEAAIRQDPAQYFWIHRRWKSKPRNANTSHRAEK